MKKTYMIPTLQVVKIQTTQFIATSIPQGEVWNNGSANSRSAGFSANDDWEE